MAICEGERISVFDRGLDIVLRKEAKLVTVNLPRSIAVVETEHRDPVMFVSASKAIQFMAGRGLDSTVTEGRFPDKIGAAPSVIYSGSRACFIALIGPVG